MITIRNISSKETYPVRHPVLRPGKSVETCQFDGDDDDETTHFGLYDDQKLLGVASLFKSTLNSLPFKIQAQLRGMAVLPDMQKMGFGQQLVRYAETCAINWGVEALWFNARASAVIFYEKLGYQCIGEPFDIGDIGKHYVMYKKFPENSTE